MVVPGCSQELDRHEDVHAAYWSALETICTAEEATAARQDEVDRARLRGEPAPPAPTRHQPGLHGSVAADLEVQLAGRQPGRGTQAKPLTGHLGARSMLPHILAVSMHSADGQCHCCSLLWEGASAATGPHCQVVAFTSAA